MDGGAWWTIVHGVAKSRTQLSDFTFPFPDGSEGKEPTCNARDLDLIPGLGRSLRGGTDNPHQYSCLENPMDRRAYGPWDLKESDMIEQRSMCTNLDPVKPWL